MTVLVQLRAPLGQRVADALPGVELVGVPPDGDLPPDVAGDVLLTLPGGSPNLGRVLARGVRWVHALGSGIDGFPLELLTGETLTCSRGASAVPIAENCGAGAAVRHARPGVLAGVGAGRPARRRGGRRARRVRRRGRSPRARRARDGGDPASSRPARPRGRQAGRPPRDRRPRVSRRPGGVARGEFATAINVGRRRYREILIELK